MMKKVAVIGVGLTKFGKHPKVSSRELFAEATFKAIEDAGIDLKDIEEAFVGSFLPDVLEHQGHIAPLMLDYIGLTGIPATHTEGACASSGAAVRMGYIAIASGLRDIVLVAGVEKMTDFPTSDVTEALALASDDLFEASEGLTFPGVFALMAKAHMDKYGTTEEQMAAVAVKNHHNALFNPYAQFHKEINIETVLNSRVIAWPLKLFDCSPISDGAAVIILASEDVAKKYTDTPVWIVASAQASDTMALCEREELTTFKAARTAAEWAYKMAGVEPKDIDIAEVHDCFTIAEIIAYEDLGFCEKGEGGKLIEEGETEIGGRIPVNTSGGLKAKGHPVGATGVAQIIEVVHQLRGEAGKRQVDGAEIGLTHNVGGTGATVTVHILRR